ncbi:MAG: DegT/DnrJ/EryC1/StrS family aminotransferase [Nanoarchaeota archaeon]
MIRPEIRQEIRQEVISSLHKLIGHDFIEITTRGDAAITAALSVVSKNKMVLIPEEGGWLSYPKIPVKLDLKVAEVKCDDAKINLSDLRQKLEDNPCGVLLYQNPGGYFAEQPMKEIYSLCRKKNCLVIMDVSGSIGTKLCEGKYADILVGSFGEWKLVEAKAGGFISAKDKDLFEEIKKNALNDALMKAQILDDQEVLGLILRRLEELPQRISFFTEKRKKIIEDLKKYEIVHKNDLGFVVVVKYEQGSQKEDHKKASPPEISSRENLINYCKDNHLPWTECPRYIRLNKPAISIEVKRLN